MTRLEELYQLNKNLNEKLKIIAENQNIIKANIMEKKVATWEQMVDDLEMLRKYGVKYFDTGFSNHKYEHFGFECRENGFFFITVYYNKNGIIGSDWLIFPIKKDEPFNMNKKEYCEMYLMPILENWDTAFKNIQNNLATQLEKRMKLSIDKATEVQKKIEEEKVKWLVSP